MKTFEFRLYPNKEQAHLLMACLAESRHIYNRMLEMVKAQYEQEQTFPFVENLLLTSTYDEWMLLFDLDNRITVCYIYYSNSLLKEAYGPTHF